MNFRTGEFLFGRRETEKRQVASLTKILTATVILDTLAEYRGKTSTCLESFVRISESATALTGTTAHLIENDFLTIRQLLYGMMLPSGNDAAQSLALYFGAFLLHQGKKDPNQFLHIVTKQAVEERV